MSKKENKETSYYRGEPQYYQDSTCKPSIYRLFKNQDLLLKYENNYYKEALEMLKNHPTNTAIKSKIKNKTTEWVYNLAFLQHYGFYTRFLDLTTELNVAKYFACCSDFKKAGFVYEVKDTKEFQNLDIKNITKKIKVIEKTSTISKTNEQDNIEININDILNKKEQNKTISSNVILDKKIFNFKFENIRQHIQQGKFVLFGNEIENDKIKGNFSKLNFNIKEEINSCDKFKTLIDLNKIGINFVALFPDDSLSMKLQALYLKMLKSGLETKDIKEYVSNDRIVKEILNKTESFKTNINAFFFVLKELLDYINEVKDNNIESLIDDILA